MLTNKGFTLIETLFVLLIICILMTFSMTLHIPEKTNEMRIDEIVLFLREAQLQAMVDKKTVEVSLKANKIEYLSSNCYQELQLDEGTYFDQYTFSFNNQGHIKGAKTLWYHTQNRDYAFVYQVGSGYFYVK